ncbi:hypothetical protein [Kocuria tytonicola]|uniref:hypothetical protein n=1 Tax=Kocuria tytonicola TaxID=2055946 RepID=UPI001F0C6729|nr:hypothetical protein [Kocuria tytonicola]
MTSPPRFPDPPGPLRDQLALDELHVFVNGLDPLAAWVACALVGAGVCLLDVADPQPVSRSDIARGPYPAEVEGQPRELALRGVLRRRSPRCVPLTAPELFPSAAVPGTVVLNAWSVAGDLVADLAAPSAPPLDPALATLTVAADGANVLRWPGTSWEHRPCRECLAEAVRSARRTARHVVPDTVGAPLPNGDSPLTAVTRSCAAGEIAALLLAAGLGLGRDTMTAHTTPERRPFRGDDHAPEMNGPRGTGPLLLEPCGPVLRRGLLVRELPPNPQCLCSLAFAAP